MKYLLAITIGLLLFTSLSAQDHGGRVSDTTELSSGAELDQATASDLILVSRSPRKERIQISYDNANWTSIDLPNGKYWADQPSQGRCWVKLYDGATNKWYSSVLNAGRTYVIAWSDQKGRYAIKIPD